MSVLPLPADPVIRPKQNLDLPLPFAVAVGEVLEVAFRLETA